MKFDELRREYRSLGLRQADWPDDPFVTLRLWLQQAVDAGIHEPNAMTLATADSDGHPAARLVLLKHLDADELGFVTNYDSRKGRQIAENPHAALVFHWQPLERQIRVEGTVEKAPQALSDKLYAERPRAAQIGAWASPQSEEIESRALLERRVRETEERFKDSISRPPNWGAYLLRPARFEFWQGGMNRLHDRLLHTLEPGGWAVRRLAP